MTTLPLGTRIYMQDGRPGRIVDKMDWGQYAVRADDPTPDEIARDMKDLIDFDKAVLVEDQVPGPVEPTT